MTKDEIFQQLKTIIADTLGVQEDRITMDTDMVNDLGADSLDIVECIMAAEEQFGVQIPEEPVEKFKTVGDGVEWLEQQLR